MNEKLSTPFSRWQNNNNNLLVSYTFAALSDMCLTVTKTKTKNKW